MDHNEFRYRRVEKQITTLIESAAIKPGDRLPSLRKLSGQLGVSISTVSQAYLELEKKGVIASRERSGFFLSPSAGRMPAPASRPRPALVPTSSSRSGLIQKVLEALGNRDLLPFGVVCPADELLPAKTLARLFSNSLRNDPARALNYAPVAGEDDLRRQLALRALEAGISVTPEEILITSGAMEGLAIALRALTKPGDNVLIQSPSYFCFLQLLENCGLRAIEIPSSGDGIDPRDVRRAIERFEIRAAILVPNFNNPDGSLTADTRKEEIVRLLGERGIPLVEDDVYGEIYFGAERSRCCKSFDDAGEVIYCSSFSKTIAPGYRVGWMIPGRHYGKALDLKTTTNICTASPNQMAIAAFLREGYFERHMRRLRGAIHNQMKALLLSLHRHFPAETRAGFPSGGAAIWVELPPDIDAVDYFFKAREAGIGLAPGPIFSTQDKYNNFIRLSCNGIWNEKMEQGVKTLGRLAEEMY
ncbi:PLP-dependent aminotransferase family protein [Geothermobacter hydrogeniphilus]|uniref:GntR family transcriptional regulator n=1 Tax=Geothermobacter hydrogeniphilus TaxID=1969733 RepID=A0A1X0XW31_9BACT|nr:PLP-dependent aminotransferase family protein [Geothermobacter hydrogeniphilus]ORJ57111.1 GntR family transcriptional regulator [Geothermobacter hydrogeniphilus]